jgi:hypothetical protein
MQLAEASLYAHLYAGAAALTTSCSASGADLTLERMTVVANSVSATSPPGPMPFGGVASASGGGISNSRLACRRAR